ncbi:MAG: AraC family transcriptional regulator [Ferruginibacter sp.]
MSFNVSEQWLRKEFADNSISLDDLIERLENRNRPGIFLVPGSLEELKIISDIETQISTDCSNILFLKAKLFSLVSHFFLKLFDITPILKTGSILSYSEKMLEIEKILIGSIEKKLPDLKSIAKDNALSVSTLKRHFKIVFEKNIYAYYLELKMEHAKRLLMETPISVNEVANKLDYGKVSSFIRIFKKHYGVSPGGIRRKMLSK